MSSDSDSDSLFDFQEWDDAPTPMPARRPHLCQNCGLAGHNKRTCTKVRAECVPGQFTQKKRARTQRNTVERDALMPATPTQRRQPGTGHYLCNNKSGSSSYSPSKKSAILLDTRVKKPDERKRSSSSHNSSTSSSESEILVDTRARKSSTSSSESEILVHTRKRKSNDRRSSSETTDGRRHSGSDGGTDIHQTGRFTLTEDALRRHNEMVH